MSATSATASASSSGAAAHPKCTFCRHFPRSGGVGYCTKCQQNIEASHAKVAAHLQQTAQPLRFMMKEKPFYELSNRFDCEVEYMGKTYPTAEHLFHACKFLTTNPAVSEEIRIQKDADSAFKIAHAKHKEERKDWHGVRESVMHEILKKKFFENPFCSRILLLTGSLVLIAHNKDTHWCNGEDDKGSNHLGGILMRVRQELQQQCAQQQAQGVPVVPTVVVPAAQQNNSALLQQQQSQQFAMQQAQMQAQQAVANASSSSSGSGSQHLGQHQHHHQQHLGHQQAANTAQYLATPADGAVIELAPLHNEKLRIDVTRGGTNDGTRLQTWSASSLRGNFKNGSQQFRLHLRKSDGKFSLSPLCAPDKAIDVTRKSGQPIILFARNEHNENQHFTFEKPPAAPGSNLHAAFTLVAHDKTVLDVVQSGGDGSQIMTFAKKDSPNQHFRLVVAGSHGASTATATTSASGVHAAPTQHQQQQHHQPQQQQHQQSLGQAFQQFNSQPNFQQQYANSQPNLLQQQQQQSYPQQARPPQQQQGYPQQQQQVPQPVYSQQQQQQMLQQQQTQQMMAHYQQPVVAVPTHLSQAYISPFAPLPLPASATPQQQQQAQQNKRTFSQKDLDKISKVDRMTTQVMKATGSSGDFPAESVGDMCQCIADVLEHVEDLSFLCAPMVLLGGILRMVATVCAAKAACHELSKRLAGLTPSIVALSHLKKDQLTVRIVDSIKATFQEAKELVAKFQPSNSGKKNPSWFEQCSGWVSNQLTALKNPAGDFEEMHKKIDRLLADHNFASRVRDDLRGPKVIPASPDPNDIRRALRDDFTAMHQSLSKAIESGTCTTVNEVRQLGQLISNINQQLPQALQQALSAHFDEKSGKIPSGDCTLTKSNPLAAGGQHRVYEGLLRGATPVALKLINAGDDACRAEAEMLRSFNCSSIVKCFGIWTAGDLGHTANVAELVNCEFVVLELLEITLEDAITQQSLSMNQKLVALYDMIGALEFLHSTARSDRFGVVAHGDLAPKQVMLNRQGRARVLDFDSSNYKNTIKMTALGAASTVSGGGGGKQPQQIDVTPMYTAPEVFKGSPKDPATDIFSFAIMLFQLFRADSNAGKQQPFSTLGADFVMKQICQGNRPAASVDELCETFQIPLVISIIISRCWDQDPKQRLRAGFLRTLKEDYGDNLLMLPPGELPDWLSVAPSSPATAAAGGSGSGSTSFHSASSSPHSASLTLGDSKKPVSKMSALELEAHLVEEGVNPKIIDFLKSNGVAGFEFSSSENWVAENLPQGTIQGVLPGALKAFEVQHKELCGFTKPSMSASSSYGSAQASLDLSNTGNNINLGGSLSLSQTINQSN